MSVKDTIKSIRAEYLKNKTWFDPTEEVEDADLLEFLLEGNTVSEVRTSGSRWWDNVDRVTEIEGRYFEYGWASTTGDMGPREAGWEFDWGSVVEVEPYNDTIVVTKYRRK